MLAPYQPAAIGTYLTIPVTVAGDPEAIEELEGMGLTFHHPGNMEPTPTLEMFYELNERLDTPLGQLRNVIRKFKQEVDRDRHLDPEAADVILKYVDDQEDMYFALNHHLFNKNHCSFYNLHFFFSKFPFKHKIHLSIT